MIGRKIQSNVIIVMLWSAMSVLWMEILEKLFVPKIANPSIMEINA